MIDRFVDPEGALFETLAEHQAFDLAVAFSTYFAKVAPRWRRYEARRFGLTHGDVLYVQANYDAPHDVPLVVLLIGLGFAPVSLAPSAAAVTYSGTWGRPYAAPAAHAALTPPQRLALHHIAAFLASSPDLDVATRATMREWVAALASV